MPVMILGARAGRVSKNGKFTPLKGRSAKNARNIPGFKDASGKFHPIRGGAGYDRELAGDSPGTGRKRKKAKATKRAPKRAPKKAAKKKAAAKKSKKKKGGRR